MLKYVTENPEIIELSYDKNTIPMYNNQTNIYMIDSNIQPETIKLTAPLTMMSTVNTLSDKFIDIDNRIEKVSKGYSNSKTYHETDNGTQVIPNVSNGILDDIHIEGKTLVNLSDTYNKITWLNENPSEAGFSKSNGYFKLDFDVVYEKIAFIRDDSILIKSGKTYTYIVNIVDNKLTTKAELFPYMWENAINKSESEYIEPGFEGRKVFKFDCVGDTQFEICYRHNNQSGRGSYRVGEIMVLEGDHTKNPPSYFEGLKSVGDGIDIISIESINKNIFEDNVINQTGRGVNGNGLIYPEMFDNVRNRCRSANLIKVKPNTNYYLSSKGKFCLAVAEFDIDNKQISDNGWAIPVTGGVYRTSARCKSIIVAIRKDDNSEITPSEVYGNIQIEEGSDKTEYIPHQSDKKQLMYYDNNYEEWLKPILRSLPNGIKDTIEKHSDGKYYYHKRCGEIILNGSDDETIGVRDNLNNTIGFTIDMGDETGNLGKVISDRFLHKLLDVSNDSDEFTRIITPNGNSCLYFKINKSKLSTQDVQGFKSWLQSNNVTVVYELSQEEIYECSPIDLQTFEDTTTMIIESGPICPKTNVSVVSNIGATLHVVKEKISNLETQMSSNNTFDSIVLLQSSYSADVASLQFNISVCNESIISNDSTIYDNDIYVLIKDVILNGRDIISLEYLESIIDFYTMVNKISYEMADELFDLLYTDSSSIEE